MPLIFLVPSKLEVWRAVRLWLEQAGYAVQSFSSASGVLREAEESHPALILIDMKAPDGRALELCQRIRRSVFLSTTPVVFLTARANEDERITALDAGADDCIGQPLSPRELVARVQAVLRRLESHAEAAGPSVPPIIKLGDIEIDRSAMKIAVCGSEIITTTLEFRLLDFLARHRGSVFTRDQLLDAVWGDTRFVTPRTVDACVRRIRRKLELTGLGPAYLKTIRGIGYRLDT